MKDEAITIVALTGDYKIEGHVAAIQKTALRIPYECKQLLISGLPPTAGYYGSWVQLPNKGKGFGTSEYSRFMVENMADHIDTKNCIIVHWDGFAMHPENWTDEFLKYDYIGAPWPYWCSLIQTHSPSLRHRVGNGGFCLRSKEWLERGKTAPKHKKEPEDIFMCRTHIKHYTSTGCRVAPVALALKFSMEYYLPDFPDWTPQMSLGFHGYMPNGDFRNKTRLTAFSIAKMLWRCSDIRKKIRKLYGV